MDATAIIRRYDQQKGDKEGYWSSLWQECADYVMPRKNNLTSLTATAKPIQKLYDPTAIEANIKLAAGLYAWLCPSDKRWFEVQAMNPALQENESVERWFATVNHVMNEALANSNWNLEVHEGFQDFDVFGTSCMYIEEGKNTILNFQTFHISAFCCLENNEGLVDTVFREFEFTARQAVQEFGKDGNLSQKIIENASKPETAERKSRFLHAVYPREDFDNSKIDQKNMPIASVWIDLESKEVVQESGYWDMPYVVYRFDKSTGEVYGRAPAITALPEIKMLNRMRKADLLGAEKAVEPPILIPDGGLVDNVFRSAPGSITFYNPGPNGIGPKPFYEGNRVDVSTDKVSESRELVRRMFFNDMFDALEERRNMTATEIVERVEAKLIAFCPTLGRLQCELFGPVFARCFGILLRSGNFPPPPPELLQDPRYKIEYVSRIALAVKQLEARGLAQTMEFIAPMLQLQPDLMDAFNTDKIVSGLAKNNGVPNEWLRTEKEIGDIRGARAQEAQAAKQAQMLEMAGKAAPGLGKAAEPGSPLAQLTGGR